MNKTEYLEGLFLAASNGNETAYEELSNEFLNLGKLIAAETINKCHISRTYFDDLCCCVGEIFIYVINSFDPTKNSFLSYAAYVLRKRLCGYVQNQDLYELAGVVSLDEINEDGVAMYEKVEDENLISVPSKLSVDRFKYEISSPKHVDSKIIKLGKNICLLEVYGYSQREIAIILNISEHKVRYAKEQFLNTKDVKNLKLELK